MRRNVEVLVLVADLRGLRRSQKQIAGLLGISLSYVCKLLRQLDREAGTTPLPALLAERCEDYRRAHAARTERL